MNLATPILIADQSEEFRSLLRDMLTKHGFFHIIETSTNSDTYQFMCSEKKEYFPLMQASIIDEKIIHELERKKYFLLIAEASKEQTTQLAARLGVKHFLSFPFSSSVLIEKIKQML